MQINKMRGMVKYPQPLNFSAEVVRMARGLLFTKTARDFVQSLHDLILFRNPDCFSATGQRKIKLFGVADIFILFVRFNTKNDI